MADQEDLRSRRELIRELTAAGGFVASQAKAQTVAQTQRQSQK